MEDGGKLGEVGRGGRGGGSEGRKVRANVEGEVGSTEGGVGVRSGRGVGAAFPGTGGRDFGVGGGREVDVAQVVVGLEGVHENGGSGAADPATAMLAVEI